MKKILTKIIKLCAVPAILLVSLLLITNVVVYKGAKDYIKGGFENTESRMSYEEISRFKSIDPDCILILGASVHPDGTPSPMLKDRLDLGIYLYKKGVAPKLLMSGDNGRLGYNEVEVMKSYAVEAGVKPKDIFLDHAGFSTYESVYRARYIFDVDSMIIVTQSYHLYRAVYGSRRMGINVEGAFADQETYIGQIKRDIREVLARTKDYFMWIAKPDPKYLGDRIPIRGDGAATH